MKERNTGKATNKICTKTRKIRKERSPEKRKSLEKKEVLTNKKRNWSRNQVTLARKKKERKIRIKERERKRNY